MKLDREGRRTAAQFLNGLAVALLASFVLTPVANGTGNPALAGGALLWALLCHILALWVETQKS